MKSELTESSRTRRLRLLIAAHGFHVGGGELSPLLLANALRARGHDITYLIVEDVSAGDPSLQPLLDPGINISRWSDAEGWFDNFIRSRNFDLLNSHNISFDYRVFQKNPNWLPPWVVSLRGSYEAASEYVTADFISFVASRVTKWLYLAEKNIGSLIEGGIGRDQFIRSFNAAPAAEPPADRESVRAKLGIPPRALALVIVSRAIPEKGWEAAILACRRLNEMHPGRVHLTLIGEGPCRDSLSKSAAGAPYLSLSGHVDQPQRLFRGFDIGLLPSTFSGESFPRFLVECFEAGLPAISTAVGAAPDIYGADPDRQPGALLSGRDDVESLVDGIVKRVDQVLREPETLRQWADNAKEVASRFSMTKLVDQYEVLFRTVASQPRLDADPFVETCPSSSRVIG